MELRHHADAASFLAAAGEYLEAHEAAHNLMLGIAGRLRASGRLWGHEPYLATVHAGGRVVLAALRTPPYGVVFSETGELEAADVVAADFAGVDLPNVLGPKAVSRRFAERWAPANGHGLRLGTAQRIFRADAVTSPPGVPGGLRAAAEADRALLVAWLQAFLDEAAPGMPGRPADDIVSERLAGLDDDALHVWEHVGRPVSLAGCGGPTPNGIRIGPVYTPPELRGRGYGSAITAALTQQLLDSGRRFCFLFTDLANPVSNRIYERIGYRPVADVDEYRFLPR